CSLGFQLDDALKTVQAILGALIVLALPRVLVFTHRLVRVRDPSLVRGLRVAESRDHRADRVCHGADRHPENPPPDLAAIELAKSGQKKIQEKAKNRRAVRSVDPE